MVNGFKTKEGFIYLVRCPYCGMENYVPAVATGICSFCGFDANDEKNKGIGNYSEE